MPQEVSEVVHAMREEAGVYTQQQAAEAEAEAEAETTKEEAEAKAVKKAAAAKADVSNANDSAKAPQRDGSASDLLSLSVEAIGQLDSKALQGLTEAHVSLLSEEQLLALKEDSLGSLPPALRAAVEARRAAATEAKQSRRKAAQEAAAYKVQRALQLYTSRTSLRAISNGRKRLMSSPTTSPGASRHSKGSFKLLSVRSWGVRTLAVGQVSSPPTTAAPRLRIHGVTLKVLMCIQVGTGAAGVDGVRHGPDAQQGAHGV
jgi:hypothetical protein